MNRQPNQELLEQALSQTTLSQSSNYQSKFENASPFKHVLMKDFLNKEFLSNILEEFPEPPSADELRNEFGGKNRKHAVHSIRDLGDTFRQWDDLLKSEVFINHLESVTGIEGLLYDPEYHGAGTHNNLDGQGMFTHVDFNLHRTTDYHRRLNLIIYINEEWDANWGGSLEIHKDPWDFENDEMSVYPPFLNDAILFETNEYSWHGFEKINLPEDKKHLSRKSLTVYYYSKTRPAEEIAPKHATIYVPPPMPKEIQPGEMISAGNYSDLVKNLKAWALYLKGMYKRESQLNQRIRNADFRLNQYKSEYYLRSTGNALQGSTASGLLPNGKVVEDLTAEFKTTGKVTKVVVHGQVPKFLGKNAIEVQINDQSFKFENLKAGNFTAKCDVNYRKGKSLKIKILSDKILSPFEVSGEADRQAFGFTFQYIEFLG